MTTVERVTTDMQQKIDQALHKQSEADIIAKLNRMREYHRKEEQLREKYHCCGCGCGERAEAARAKELAALRKEYGL